MTPKVLLQLILDVFPDVERQHAKSLLARFRITEDYHIPTVLEHLADNSYPKEKNQALLGENEGEKEEEEQKLIARAYSNNNDGEEEAPRRTMKDYESVGWTTSGVYREEAVKVLMEEFPFLRIDELKMAFAGEKFRHHFNVFHRAVCVTIAGTKTLDNPDNMNDEDEATQANEKVAKALSGGAIEEKVSAQHPHSNPTTTTNPPNQFDGLCSVQAKKRLLEMGLNPLKKSRKRLAGSGR